MSKHHLMVGAPAAGKDERNLSGLYPIANVHGVKLVFV
jgi:hypothetical protein